MTFYLTFPGESETDYTSLLRQDSVVITERLMNDECRSTVDTCTFEIKYNQAVQALLFSATTWIGMRLVDGATPLFKGVIAPTSRLKKTENVRPIRLEAIDNTYLLDRPINTSFNYPASIGGTAYAILDADNSADNVIWELLDDAGYTPATDIDATCPDISTTVEYFQGTEGAESYRQWIDALLEEYGHVLYTMPDGDINVYQWDKDTVTSTETIDEDIEIEKINNWKDGVEVEFARTETNTDALLYRDNLPLSQNSDGVWAFDGAAIANNDYYPPDGDVADIYQRYTTKWLDTEWLDRLTRVKNEDLALIAADVTDAGVLSQSKADPGVTIYSSTYEKKRSKVLWQNTSGATAKIYNFEIHGTALYRKYRLFTKVPTTSVDPIKYQARFLYDDSNATALANARRYARAKNRMRVNGSFKYKWADRTKRALGTIVTVNMTDPSVNQTCVIIERRYNPDLTTYNYVARGITAYSATATTNWAESPSVTPTQEQQAADLTNTNIVGNQTKIGTSSGQNSLGVPVVNAVRCYMGVETGDHGQGFYIKEWNGVSWETRGRLSVRDPSVWLEVQDMAHSHSLDSVGLV